MILLHLLLITLTNASPQMNVGNTNSRYGTSDDIEDYCYSLDKEPYLYFGTKTSYDALPRRAGQLHIVPGCQPVQFWSLNRHGTRLPKASKITKLKKLQDFLSEVVSNYEQRKSYPNVGKLCFDDYNMLRQWRWNNSITEDKAASLTQQGINELRLLARRYWTKFPKIFNRGYSEQAFHFQYTQSDRTHDSYQAYIEGLFDQDYYKVHANTYGSDLMLKPYRNCPQWAEQVENNSDTNTEYEKFLQSNEYQTMVKNVFRRLGFMFSLNETLVQEIYDMCRFDKAWQLGQPSPWCASFTKEHLKLLEYGEDLKDYYNTGHGSKLVKKIGCGPVQDMYRKFERTVQGYPDGNKVTALFTHAATMQAVYSTLGIAKDYDLLKADNYAQQQRRLWRTSLINPFASNLAAVLYECNNQPRNQFKVMFFLNEMPIEEFLGCSVGLCDWATVENNFLEMVENCNVEAFCDGSGGSRLEMSLGVWLVVSLWVANLFV